MYGDVAWIGSSFSLCNKVFDFFFCFSAFNNVYSNIGYIMLGILFILLVVRRCVSRYLLCKTIRNILKIKLERLGLHNCFASKSHSILLGD